MWFCWGNIITHKMIPLPIDEPIPFWRKIIQGVFPNIYLHPIKKMIDKVSPIINAIIPGLKMVFEQVGTCKINDYLNARKTNSSNMRIMLEQMKTKGQIDRDQDEYINFYEFKTDRDGVKVPLRFESDGIKRIFSIVYALAVVYNSPKSVLVVDEMDSGIFEDLLGNLLRVFYESGKGQLIFTSHNLRPLEVLPSECIRFTTTNPKNRFFKITKRGNSNLRDVYRRAIHLGGFSEKLYNDVDNTDLKVALEFDVSNDTDSIF